MFCAKLAKISGERLQDQWSSGCKFSVKNKLGLCSLILPYPNFFIIGHHDNKSVQCIPPYTPLLYSKNRFYRG